MPSDRRQVIFVLGMHRSGTSLIAKFLQCSGGRLPTKLLPPQPDNPKGFFEPEELVAINDMLLTGLGSSWFDVKPLPTAWLKSKEADSARSSINSWLVREVIRAEGDAPLVVKDPRLCLLLPLYLEICEDLALGVSTVLSLRHPREVSRSFKRRGEFAERADAMWLRYTLDAELYSRETHRIALAYGDVLESAEEQFDSRLRKLTVFSDAFFNSDNFSQHADKALRHHELDESELELHPWLGELYRKARELPSPSALETFDQVREQLALAWPIVSSAVVLAESGASTLHSAVLARDASINELTGALQAAKRESAAVEHRLAEHSEQIDSLTRRLKARERDLTAAEGVNAEQADELASCEDRIDRLERRVTALHNEIRERDKSLLIERDEFEHFSQAVQRLSVPSRYRPRDVLSILKLLRAAKSFDRGKLRSLVRDYLTLGPTGLLDRDWYNERYDDVKRSGVDPVVHYLLHGYAEGRTPNPRFDSRAYKQEHPEAWGTDPYLHYLRTRGTSRDATTVERHAAAKTGLLNRLKALVQS
ncbi:MAG: hypothetical protein AAF662_07340 [Pseudomonadota bacterium]